MSPRGFDLDRRVIGKVKWQGPWNYPLRRQRKDTNTQVLFGPVVYGAFAIMQGMEYDETREVARVQSSRLGKCWVST